MAPIVGLLGDTRPLPDALLQAVVKVMDWRLVRSERQLVEALRESNDRLRMHIHEGNPADMEQYWDNFHSLPRAFLLSSPKRESI